MRVFRSHGPESPTLSCAPTPVGETAHPEPVLSALPSHAALKGQQSLLGTTNTAAAAWGSAYQVRITYAASLDKVVTLASAALGQPLARAKTDKEMIAQLRLARQQLEKQWGQPVMDPAIEAQLDNGAFFAACKALRLEALGIHPKHTREGFIDATGSVDGKELPADRLFWQEIVPEQWNKVSVPAVHGYMQSGRDYQDAVLKELFKRGYALFTIDQRGYGQSSGQRGNIGTAERIARNAAAAVASADAKAKERDPAGRASAMLGSSLGGMGAFLASTYNDNDRLALDGPQMPKGVKGILLAPYFGPAFSFATTAVRWLGRSQELAAMSTPTSRMAFQLTLGYLIDDPDQIAQSSVSLVAEDAQAQIGALAEVQPGLDRFWQHAEEGVAPNGEFLILQAEHDPIASPRMNDKMMDVFSNVQTEFFKGNSHVFENKAGMAKQIADQLDAWRNEGSI